MSAEERFAISSKIWNEALESVDDGNPAEGEDKNEEEEKLPDATMWSYISGNECIPRDDTTKNNEKG